MLHLHENQALVEQFVNLLFTQINPDELATVIETIEANYTTLALRDNTRAVAGIEVAEHIFYLRLLKETFLKINKLKTTLL